MPTGVRNAQVEPESFEGRGSGRPARARRGVARPGTTLRTGGRNVTRALRSHGLWLTVTYLALILLMTRAYG